jgi:prevent-host-death family protein
MTRIRQTAAKSEQTPSSWSLQDAKARLSEVVRKARTEGPQKITLHGREEVVVVSIEEYRRMKGEPTGALLVKMLQESPLRDLEFERVRTPARSRRVKL